MNISDLVQCLNLLPPSQAVLIQGDTGIGKSALVHKLSVDLRLPLVDARASTLTEGDMGYPNLDKIKELDMTVFTLPSWYIRACREPVVLFLDEWNRGVIGVLNAMMQITLDRQFGNDKDGNPVSLHPETRIIAAINVGSEFQVSTIDKAHINRFWLASLEMETSEWIDWAKNAGGIDPLIIDFIRDNEKFLIQNIPGDGTNQEPTPRSWAKFDKALKHNKFEIESCRGNLPSWFYKLATGFIGAPTAQALTAYIKDYKYKLTAEDIYKNWSPKILDAAKALFTEGRLDLIEKLCAYAKTNNLNPSETQNLYGFWGVLTGEEKMFLFKNIQENDSSYNAFFVYVGAEIVTLVNRAQAAAKG